MKRIFLCVLLLAACKRSDDKNVTSGEPQSRPPVVGAPAVPADLKIPVELDGHDAPAIDAARLAQLKPDFEEPGRRAWLLQTVLGTPLADATVEIERADGVKVALPARAADGKQAALLLDRRGEVLFAVLLPSEPFPAFHGRGGNRGRPGDPLTRVRDLKRIRVTRPAR